MSDLSAQNNELPEFAAQGVDANTGEISAEARAGQIQEHLDFLSQMGRTQGWTNEALAKRTALQQELDLLSPVRLVEMSRGELIVDGAITAAKIAAKTITAAEIASGTITATELGANSVTANAIAANSVIAGKIAANAVTADSIAANSVTTAKIAAGAVSATELAAGSVLASKLLVADTTNVYGDFDCVDPNYCTAVTGSFVYSTSGAAYNGKNIVNIPSFTGATEVVSSWFVMDAGAEYLITQRISTSVNDATGLASTYIELASYNSVTVVPTRRELIGQTGSTSANPFTLSVALTTSERYGRIIYARAAGGTSRAYIGAPTIRPSMAP